MNNTNILAEVTDLQSLAAIQACAAVTDVRTYLMWMHVNTKTGVVTAADGNRAARAQVLLPYENGTEFLWKPERKIATRSTEVPMLMERGDKAELQAAGKTLGYGEYSRDADLLRAWEGVVGTLNSSVFAGGKYEMHNGETPPRMVAFDISLVAPVAAAVRAAYMMVLPATVTEMRESTGPLRIAFVRNSEIVDLDFAVMPCLMGDHVENLLKKVL